MIEGLDCHYAIPPSGWDCVQKAGLKFAFFNLRESANYKKNIPEARGRGIKFGFYYFAYPLLHSAETMARQLVQAEKDHGADLVSALDLEHPVKIHHEQKPFIWDWIQEFVNVYGVLTDNKCLIYSAPWWITQLRTLPLDGHPYWVAQYPIVANTWPLPVEPFKKVDLWQYRGNALGAVPGGMIPGINHDVDLNKFRGSIEDLCLLGRV